LLQSSPESSCGRPTLFSSEGHQGSDTLDPGALLRTCETRPRSRATKKNDEFPSSHARPGTTHTKPVKLAHLRGSVCTLADVRFGSKADIRALRRHVRFTPKSGH
jgi:hypothetical protein